MNGNVCFRHIGIVSEDIERSIEFYQNFFGFVVVKDVIEEGKFVNNICGIEDKSVRTVKMSLNGKIALELLHFDGQCDNVSSKALTEKGYTHMALTVKNISKLYVKMCSCNIEFTTEPLISPDGKAKVTFCKDPDGNFIELVQEL